jgi:hypothetical protein
VFCPMRREWVRCRWTRRTWLWMQICVCTHLTDDARRDQCTNTVNLGQRGAGIGHHAVNASLQGPDLGIKLGETIEPFRHELGSDSLVLATILRAISSEAALRKSRQRDWYPGWAMVRSACTRLATRCAR